MINFLICIAICFLTMVAVIKIEEAFVTKKQETFLCLKDFKELGTLRVL